MSFIKGISELAKGRVNQVAKFAQKNVLKNIGTPILNLQKGLAELNGKVLEKRKGVLEKTLSKHYDTGNLTVDTSKGIHGKIEKNKEFLNGKAGTDGTEETVGLNKKIKNLKDERQTTIKTIGEQHEFIGLDYDNNQKKIKGSKVKTFQLNDKDRLAVIKTHVEKSETLNSAHFETGALLKLLNSFEGSTHKDKIITALLSKEKFKKQLTAHGTKLTQLTSDNTTNGHTKLEKAKRILLSKLGISEEDYNKIKAAKQTDATPVASVTNGSETSPTATPPPLNNSETNDFDNNLHVSSSTTSQGEIPSEISVSYDNESTASAQTISTRRSKRDKRNEDNSTTTPTPKFDDDKSIQTHNTSAKQDSLQDSFSVKRENDADSVLTESTDEANSKKGSF